jgi:hypothetical protein
MKSAWVHLILIARSHIYMNSNFLCYLFTASKISMVGAHCEELYPRVGPAIGTEGIPVPIVFTQQTIKVPLNPLLTLT